MHIYIYMCICICICICIGLFVRLAGTLNTHVDVTHLHVWHDSFFIYTQHNVTNPHLWHYSSTCVTWLIHMCDMTHPGRHGGYSARLRTTNRRRPFQRRSLGVNLSRTPPPTLPSYIRTIHRDLGVVACGCGLLAGKEGGGGRQVILSGGIDFLSERDVT